LSNRLKVLAYQIAEEAVDGTQSNVPGAGFILSVRLQVLEEAKSLFGGQMFHREGAGIPLFAGHKAKE
jgi:hypothetical protein